VRGRVSSGESSFSTSPTSSSGEVALLPMLSNLFRLQEVDEGGARGSLAAGTEMLGMTCSAGN
jgi:hypothetical protein